MMPGERPLRRALSFLDDTLADPAVTEVVINRPGEFGVERAGTWTWHDNPAVTLDLCDTIGILSASSLGKNFDGAHPLSEGRLPDKHRVQACRPPATEQGILALTIRKPSMVTRSVDDDDFEGMFAETNRGPSRAQRADAELITLKAQRRWRDFFKLAARVGKTIGACGVTGSGKTDLIKRLMLEIPEGERLITAQNVVETGDLRQRNHVHLVYTFGAPKGSGRSCEDCGEAMLRMRPDRSIIGELRDGGEAFSFLRVLAAGGKGGMTTWHADEGEAFDALELMLKQHPAGAQIPDEKIKKHLRRYLDIIVWMAKGEDGFTAPSVWFKAEHDAAQ